MSVSDKDPPVAGSSNLVTPAVRSKWSRRGRWKRSFLLCVLKLATSIVAMFRAVRWVIENL